MALTAAERHEWETQGRRAYRSMSKPAHWGALAPVTMSASSASRYNLPAEAPTEVRAAWCAGFDAARDAATPTTPEVSP